MLIYRSGWMLTFWKAGRWFLPESWNVISSSHITRHREARRAHFHYGECSHSRQHKHLGAICFFSSTSLTSTLELRLRVPHLWCHSFLQEFTFLPVKLVTPSQPHPLRWRVSTQHQWIWKLYISSGLYWRKMCATGVKTLFLWCRIGIKPKIRFYTWRDREPAHMSCSRLSNRIHCQDDNVYLIKP